jgi:DNA-binding transcriptional LysR family regulator
VGRLRVGFVEAATYSGILAEVLGVFRRDLPEVSIGLFEMDSLEQAEALREGRIDVGIVHSPPPDAHRWLRVERVIEDGLVAALPRAHPLAARRQLTLGDLAGEPFVLPPRFTGPTLYDHLIAACRSAGFSPRVVQEAAGWSTLAALVAAGVGVSFAPRSIAQVERPGVVYRPVRGLSVDMGMSVVWKQDDESAVRERFLAVLRAAARGAAGGRDGVRAPAAAPAAAPDPALGARDGAEDGAAAPLGPP